MDGVDVRLPESLVRMIVDANIISRTPSIGNIDRRMEATERQQKHIADIVCAIVWKQAREVRRIQNNKT